MLYTAKGHCSLTVILEVNFPALVATSIVAVSSYSGLKGCIHDTIICQYLYVAAQMTKRMVEVTTALLQCSAYCGHNSRDVLHSNSYSVHCKPSLKTLRGSVRMHACYIPLYAIIIRSNSLNTIMYPFALGSVKSFCLSKL